MEASDDPSEIAKRKAIARWIREFFDPQTGIEAQLRGAKEAEADRLKRADGDPGDRPYMEGDGLPSVLDMQ